MRQLAGHSGRQPDSSCPTPIAPESQAAKATASGCPAGSVSPSPAPRTRLVPCRPPWRTQARLRSRHPDSSEQASKPLPLTVALPLRCRKRLPVEQHSPATLPHFPCCPLGRRNPPPAWSVPAPCRDDRHTPRCRMRAPVQSSHTRACPQTTVAVPPSPRSPLRGRQEHRGFRGSTRSSIFRACASWMICLASSKRCKARE